MDRETRKTQTPEGYELTLKTYLTARERNSLRDLYLKAAKVSVDTAGTQSQSFTLDGSVLSEIHNKLIETVVVKYKEITSSDAILNTLLESKPEEYDFVVEEANKLNANLAPAK
ncbi:MAG: hypothetical protein M3P98_01570 [bacterium]|nr:hypothetical protein [bacterium]